MKKTIFIATAITTMSVFTGCNSCTQLSKELQSDFTELDRDVNVINPFTGDTLFNYSGPCYFSANGGVVTLIYKDRGHSKKADWAGDLIFQAIEK